MNLRFNSNVSVLNSHRNMTATSNLQAKNLDKLSSGLNIKHGADGPGGHVLSMGKLLARRRLVVDRYLWVGPAPEWLKG